MEQIALIGLYGACMAYDPAKCCWLLSYLWWQMQKAFQAQRNALRRDAMGHAASGDATIGKDGSDFALFDLLPDECAGKAMRAVEEDDFRQYTRRLLESALASLPQKRSRAVWLHCAEGMPQKATAREVGIPSSNVCRDIKQGLAALYKCPQLQQFKRDYTRAKTANSAGLYVWRASDDTITELRPERAAWRQASA